MFKTYSMETKRNYDELVRKEFSFLISDFGFEQPEVFDDAFQRHYAYKKDNVSIEIICQVGFGLPWILLCEADSNGEFGANCRSYGLEKLDTDDSLKDIDDNFRSERAEIWDENISNDEQNVDQRITSQLEDNYQSSGLDHIEAKLFEYARLIKENPEILEGNTAKFSAWQQFKKRLRG